MSDFQRGYEDGLFGRDVASPWNHDYNDGHEAGRRDAWWGVVETGMPEWWVVVETGMPEQPARVGVGSTLREAYDALESTPVQSEGRDGGLADGACLRPEQAEEE